MYEDFFYDRLTKLSLEKSVSQREMSLSMGQSEGYTTKIEGKASFPSITVFFYICEYFSIIPRDFFDDGLKKPALLQEAIDGLKELSEYDLALILGNIKRLRDK